MRRFGRGGLAWACLALFTVASAQVAIVDSDAELAAALSEGGAYRIMPREYVLTEPVVVRHDLELVGTDTDSVHIEALGGPVALTIEGDVDVTLEALRFVYQGESGADLVVVRGARLNLREVNLGFARFAAPSDPPMPGREDGHGSGIVLLDGATLTADRLGVAQNQIAGIEVRGNARVELVEPTIVANFRGLVALGDVQLEVRGGSVTGHFAHGLLLNGQTLEASFDEVLFSDNGNVDLAQDASWPAAVIGGASSVTFRGGSMRDMAATGLVLAGASQVRMFGTTFDDVGGQHEGFDRPLTALVVQGNAHLTVEDGVLSANPGGALEVAEGGALVMRRVRVERNGGWTHTSIGGSGTAIVQDSTFAGNEGTLFVGGQATLGLASSELSGSGGYGLVVTVGAAATVVDSVIADNGEDGVWVDGNAFLDLRTTVVRGSRVGVWVSGEARAALSGNDLHDNDGAGVAVVGSARAELLGNAFARSPVGVLLQDEGGVQGSENVFAEVGQQMMDAR